MASSVGEYLREKRTARGLTLEQASQTTHIRKSFLEAIENGKHDALPSEVQGRGFLRLYAGFLDLPAEPLIQAWINKEPVIIPESVTDEPEKVEDDSSPGIDLPPQENSSELQPRTADLTDEQEQIQPDAGPVPVEFHTYQAAEIAISGSQSIFKEIGELLRQQRETLGLSRTEVERYTRLRQHYLLALEEGRLDLLPSPVQGRGMLSIYASFLNMNEDKLLLRFAEGLQLRRIERLPQPEPQTIQSRKKPARQTSALQRFLTPDLIFGIVIAVGILFFAVRTALSISSIQNRDTQPTARAIAEILLTPDETEIVPSSADPNIDLTNGVEAETITAPDDNIIPVIEVTTTPTIQPTLAPINRDPLQLYIVANQRAYLRVVVDNQEKFNGRVVPGNAYAFSGVKRIELITGNAEALQVFFNQSDIGTIGTSGQATGLVFVPEGLITATPFQSPTPTFGALPTETPRPTSTYQSTYTVTPLIP